MFEFNWPSEANDSLGFLAGHEATGMGTKLVAVIPEVFVIITMACLLLGMSGSTKFMRMAGTTFIIAIIGGLVNAIQ